MLCLAIPSHTMLRLAMLWLAWLRYALLGLRAPQAKNIFYTTSASLPDANFFILPPCAPQAKEKNILPPRASRSSFFYHLREPPGRSIL